MREITQLKMLIEAEMQYNTLARFCKCSPKSIKNYIDGVSLPNGEKLINIREGIAQLQNIFEKIWNV